MLLSHVAQAYHTNTILWMSILCSRKFRQTPLLSVPLALFHWVMAFLHLFLTLGWFSFCPSSCLNVSSSERPSWANSDSKFFPVWYFLNLTLSYSILFFTFISLLIMDNFAFICKFACLCHWAERDLSVLSANIYLIST